jgi:hypothetical protein
MPDRLRWNGVEGPTRTRRAFVACVSALSLAGLSRPHPAEAGEEEEGTAAALAWLEGVDGGRYGESWDEAAPALKDAVSRKQWDQALQSVRAPLGKVLSRRVRSRKVVESLPGAPRGPYVVVELATVFELKDTVETVTPARTADGTWRVAGYFIR